MKRGGFCRNVCCFFSLVVFLWGTSVFAADLSVNWQQGPYTDIQSAIDDAMDGDVIHVADGTYPGNLFIDKAITIESENGASNCVINGGGTTTGVIFSGSDASGAVLNGFTISGGNAIFGGGIACYEASPIISYCVIENNNASYGGGLFVKNASSIDPSPTLIACKILDNTAIRGGGVFLHTFASPDFYNCVIAGNIASEYGGAFYCYNQCAPDIIHCTVSDNSAAAVGGGIYCLNSPHPYFPVVTNSILWRNTAPSGAEIFLSNSLLDITFSAFNPGVENSNLQVFGATSSLREQENLYEDPAFIDELDYNLSPGSPCIDAGMALGGALSILRGSQADPLETDIEGDPRVFGDAPDMGADEYVEEEPEFIQVEIDIKPGCRKNRIDLRSWGLLPVAVKTTKDFNAKEIDPRTVEIAGAKPVWRMYYDLDRDRDKDMVFFFRIRKLDLDGECTEATLTGMTKGKMPFAGTDKVTVIQPKCKAKHRHFCKCR